jgi:hypothetical protein
MPDKGSRIRCLNNFNQILLRSRLVVSVSECWLPPSMSSLYVTHGGHVLLDGAHALEGEL